MRKISFVIIATAFALAACEKDNKTIAYTEETVLMGTNSASDVYYSFANGTVSTVNRSDWDIAFSVPKMSATILINEGAGVELFCVGDTNDWGLVNEHTIDALEPRYNDKSDWETGAFNMNVSGMFNYGWGTYHQGSPDHNVGGDSLYVIKLTDGSYKKLMIRVKLGASSSNVIRWANLDGSSENVKTLSTAPYYNMKYFMHYSLVDQAVVEVEPDMGEWDLLFTRYVLKTQAGPGVFMNQMYTGVLGNPDVTVAKVTGIPPEKALETDASEGYSDAANAIGHDWKTFNPATLTTSLVDSTSYFVTSVDGNKYQLYFTNYGGLAVGTISFKVKRVE
jgi:hypothetical protein